MMRVVGRFWTYARVVRKQLARNPRRTVLTFLGLVLSFFLYTGLSSVLATLNQLLEQSASETVLVLGPRNDVGGGLFRPEIPRSYLPTVRETQGVVAASPVRVYFAEGRRESMPVIAALGIESETFFSIHRPPSVTEDELRALRGERTAALVGQPVLDANGWKLGDKITLRPPGGLGAPLNVHLVGDIAGDDRRVGAAVLVNIDYLEDVAGDVGRTTFIQARIARAEFAGSMSQRIDEIFTNFSVPTSTTSEKAHMANVLSSLSEAFGALRAIGYLALAVTVLVVGNSVSMSIRERTVEIGTLRALGFSKTWVFGMVMGEAVLVSILGSLVGTLAAFAMLATMQEGQGLPITLVAQSSILLEVIPLSIPVGVLASLQPVVAAVRMPIANALRYAG
jgi:putative ABC transport system permease protein